MGNNIKNFKQELEDSKINKEYNSTLKGFFYFKQKPTYTFHLCSDCHYLGVDRLGDKYECLIDLDDEDIKYFKNKYFPKLDSEMEEKINKIKQEYGK